MVSQCCCPAAKDWFVSMDERRRRPPPCVPTPVWWVDEGEGVVYFEWRLVSHQCRFPPHRTTLSPTPILAPCEPLASNTTSRYSSWLIGIFPCRRRPGDAKPFLALSFHLRTTSRPLIKVSVQVSAYDLRGALRGPSVFSTCSQMRAGDALEFPEYSDMEKMLVDLPEDTLLLEGSIQVHGVGCVVTVDGSALVLTRRKALSGASPVLARMLEEDITDDEDEDNNPCSHLVLDLRNCHSQPVKAIMAHFLQAPGKEPQKVPERLAQQLLDLSTCFGARSLRVASEASLVDSISVENVLKYWRLASRCQAHTLQERCSWYMKTNLDLVKSEISREDYPDLIRATSISGIGLKRTRVS